MKGKEIKFKQDCKSRKKRADVNMIRKLQRMMAEKKNGNKEENGGLSIPDNLRGEVRQDSHSKDDSAVPQSPAPGTFS